MPKLKEAGPSRATSRVTAPQIKAVLSAADEARRRTDADSLQAGAAERARLRTATEKLLTPYWKKTGLDVAAFEKNRAQADTAMRRRAEQQKAAAIKESSTVRDGLRAGLESWHTTLERFRATDATLVSPFVPGFVLLETPFIIWPTLGLVMEDSHVEPRNNWAKITGRSERSSGTENLRFIFVWDNPHDRFTAINVASFLRLNGSCGASADGGTAGIFPGGTSHLHLKAFLNVWEWWNQPPTNPVQLATQTRAALDMSADGGGWFSAVGDIEVKSVNGNFDVGYDLFVLPPNGVAVFEVTLLVSYENDGGLIQVDFSSGSFDVMCPELAIAVLT
jgi:hypothetical protein